MRCTRDRWILRDGDSVLMCLRHPDREWVPDVWDFPGGHIEADEAPQQALVGELEEEAFLTDAPCQPPDEVLTLYHLEQPEQALSEAVRITRHGGRIVCTHPDHESVVISVPGAPEPVASHSCAF